MYRMLLMLISFVLVLLSCQNTEEKVASVSEEHARLIGTWQENDTTENTIWKFDEYEVKWKGFSHFYKVSGDSLIISGMVHRILEQSDSTMKIVKLNGKECTLNRKK